MPLEGAVSLSRYRGSSDDRTSGSFVPVRRLLLIEGMTVVLFKPVRLAASASDSIGAAHGFGVRYAQCSAESVSESLMQIKHLPAGAKNPRTVAINFACDLRKNGSGGFSLDR